MKSTKLNNFDNVEVFEENGNVVALKKGKDGKQIINKLNVSRDIGNCFFSNIIALSNSAFYIVWMSKTQENIKIYGRRYTPQGLAGKINEFSISKKPSFQDLKIELKDDFFIVLTWNSIDGNIYKKVFNQDAESKSEELFVAKAVVDDVKKNFKESDENIKYKIVDPPVVEKTVAKEETIEPLNVFSKDRVFRKPKNMLMPLKPRTINLQTISGKGIVLNEKPVLPPISTRELVMKNKRKFRSTMRMKFK